MSVTKSFICVSCPVGCQLSVTVDESGNVTDVKGNTCPRGVDYAKAEVSNPTRVFTSTVRIRGGALPVCPVRSRGPVPKNRVFDIAKELASIELDAPVTIGQVVIQNIVGSGVDIIASRSLKISAH